MGPSGDRNDGGSASPRLTTDWSLRISPDEQATNPEETVELRKGYRTPGPRPSKMDKCRGCGGSLGEGVTVCSSCGLMLQAESSMAEPPPNLCSNPACGVANVAGERRCVRCGEAIPMPEGTVLLGRYRLEKVLKIGGFGAVYRALDEQSNRLVAIKDMIQGDPTESAKRLTFFRREADILRALDGESIVPRLYEFFHQGETAHLVIEFIKGADLLEILKTNGKPFQIAEVVEWGKQICHVLQVMHDLSPPVVYRDLKPDNIMLVEGGRTIKMIDFGTARDLGRSSKSRMASKTRVYTEQYAPPEQVAGKPEVRSDLYALAATLFHLATGKEPVGFDTWKEIEGLLGDSSAILLTDRWFYELLRINLSEDANKRYPTARHFKADLEARAIRFNFAAYQSSQEQGSQPFQLKQESITCRAVPTPDRTPLSPWEPEPPPSRPQPSSAVALAPTPLMDPLASLRAVCQRNPPDWSQILLLANEARQAGHVLPLDIHDLERKAQARYDCLWKLQRAFEAGTLQDIVAAYKPGLLDDWPECADQVVRARNALHCVKKLAEIESAVEAIERLAKNAQEGNGLEGRIDKLLERWTRDAPLLTPWPDESEKVRKSVRVWETRKRYLENLRSLVNDKTPSEKAIVEAWRKLQEVGGHPSAAVSLQARVEQASLRAACLESLPPQGSPKSENEDALVLRAWNEVLLQDCPEAELHRARYNNACKRLEIVAKLDRLISEADQVGNPVAAAQAERSVACERSIVDSALQLPSRYVHRHADRVRRAKERIEASEQLAIALQKECPWEIRKRWEAAQAVELFMDVETVRRCQLAERRCVRLDEIDKIKDTFPADRQDALWLKSWHPQLFQGYRDPDKWRRYKMAVDRDKAWKALDAALKVKDLESITSLAGNPLLAKYPPVEKAQGQLQDLLEQARYLQKSRELLQKADILSYIAHFDLEYIRSHINLFKQDREALEGILQRWMNEHPVITRADPVAVEESETGLILVRWTWRHFGRISHCRVAVSPQHFFQDSADTSGQFMIWDAEHHRRAGGGIPLSPVSGKRRLYVSVWPVIDLGWEKPPAAPPIIGPPLHLGPVRFRNAGDRALQ